MGSAFRQCQLVLVAALMLLASTQPLWAQTKKPAADTKALDKAIHESLDAVINHGADLYNKYADYAGCYHTYRAGLITIKPFLAHRPDLQKTIEDGLAAAEERGRVQARAFALNKVLFNVRKQVAQRSSAVAGKVGPDKGSGDKGVTEEKTSPPAQKMARISGKITYKGKPVTGFWYVTFVSATDKHTFSTYIRADGTYAFKTPLPPGTFTVAIEAGPRAKDFNVAEPPNRTDLKKPKMPVQKNGDIYVAIPQRYENPVTSGLTIEVRPGSATWDVDLK
jgi:hypothetical protein